MHAYPAVLALRYQPHGIESWRVFFQRLQLPDILGADLPQPHHLGRFDDHRAQLARSNRHHPSGFPSEPAEVRKLPNPLGHDRLFSAKSYRVIEDIGWRTDSIGTGNDKEWFQVSSVNQSRYPAAGYDR